MHSDGILRNIPIGTVVEINYGAFTGVQGEVVCEVDVAELSGMVVAPDSQRSEVVSVRVDLDGVPVLLGVSPELLSRP